MNPLYTRYIIIVAMLGIIAALTFFNSSGLKESFWTNTNPAAYVDEPVGIQSELSALLISDNATSPEQCSKGSSYSSSGGCIIFTAEQKRLIQTRGGNRTSEPCNESF